MHALTEQQVRRSFVNCSQGEAKGLSLPKGFDSFDWSELDLLGWRDPKAPLRGYLVIQAEGAPVGIALRAAETRMSSRTAAMCLLCQTAQPGDNVSLFTAKRLGRRGATATPSAPTSAPTWRARAARGRRSRRGCRTGIRSRSCGSGWLNCGNARSDSWPRSAGEV